MFQTQIYKTSRHFAFIAHLKGFFCFLTIGASVSLSGKFAAVLFIGGRLYMVAIDLKIPAGAKRMDLFKRATFQTEPFNNLKTIQL